MRALRPLNRGDWGGGRAALVRRLGVRAVLVHAGLFAGTPGVEGSRAAAERGLQQAGYRLAAGDGSVSLWLPAAP
jgi:hypothetical protein